MRQRKLFWLTCLSVMLLVLSACGSSNESLTPTMDTTLIYTQAAQTVVAQFTQTSAAQTAAAPTMTNTPASTPTVADTFTPIATLPIFTFPAGGNTPSSILTPTFSLLPLQGSPTGALCDNSAYVTDVGTVDGTILKPGQQFAKGWLIQNTGTCNWKVGYHLVQVGGNTNFGGDTFAIHFPSEIVLAGTIVEISLNLVAPKQPGTYEARYQMYTNLDIPFGTGMTVAVEVRK
jgi:Ig-like domain from next to BRCA1 gene